MKIAKTKERILKYIEKKKLTKTIFFNQTGIKRGFLDADKLNQAVSDEHFAKIIATYPDINLEWLLTGKGEMLKDNGSVISQTIKGNGNISNDNINIPIQTTSQELSEDKELLKELRNIIKDKDQIIADLREELKEKREELKEIKEELKEKNSQIQDLLNIIHPTIKK